MWRVIQIPVRYRALRIFLLITLLVGGLAVAAVFVAQRWTDSSASFTIAFLVVFAASIAGVLTLWVGAISARPRATRTLDGLLSLTPSEFEVAVARMLPRLGYRHVSVVGGSGDLAADIICTDKQGGLVVVQCKRKQPGQRVGSAEMQKFIGMISVHHEADAGIFVTTSEFTQPAIDLAERHGILLLDGQALGRMGRSGRAQSAAA